MAITLRLFILIVVLGFAFPAQAAEKVRTRGWSDETNGRIIFDWPSAVTFTAAIVGDKLTVKFARAMETDLNRVLKYLGSYVENATLSGSGKVATFDLAGLFEFEAYKTGKSVVIDLRRTEATPKASRDLGLAPLRVRVGRHPGFTRLVFDWLDRVEYTVGREASAARIRFQASGTIDTRELAKALPDTGFGRPVSRMDGAELMLELVIPETSLLRHFRTGAKIVVDILDGTGNFGGMVAAEPEGGPIVQTISPTGEILAIPAMVGTTVAVAPQDSVPLITEDVASVPANPVRTPYRTRPGYDPNAPGLPRSLLLYDRSWLPAAPVVPVAPVVPATPPAES